MFHTIPDKNLSKLFCGYQRTDSQTCMKKQNNQHNIAGKEQIGELTLPHVILRIKL